jgi:hypothetical protein
MANFIFSCNDNRQTRGLMVTARSGKRACRDRFRQRMSVSKLGDGFTDSILSSRLRVGTRVGTYLSTFPHHVSEYPRMAQGALPNKRSLALKRPRFGDSSFPSICPDADVCLVSASLYCCVTGCGCALWRTSGQRGEGNHDSDALLSIT